MPQFVYSLTWSACLLCAGSSDAPAGSYLHGEDRAGGSEARPWVEAYTPQAGDIVFFDDHSVMWKVLYKMAGTDIPDHSGMVVKLPDGRPALLEAGPDDGRLAGPYIRLLDAPSRLSSYPGTLWIRKLKKPLEPEQSARLTEFALEQEGKRYAVGRLLLQGTPFRCRGPVRDYFFGKTDLQRSSWLCAELVVGAGTSIGLFDPKIHHANRIYPRDIVDDQTYDLSADLVSGRGLELVNSVAGVARSCE